MEIIMNMEIHFQSSSLIEPRSISTKMLPPLFCFKQARHYHLESFALCKHKPICTLTDAVVVGGTCGK